MDVLREWGCTWMWEDMRLTGVDGWLEEAIRDNSLVAVTDGSYMQDKYPNMNSCAFILECTKGRGRLTGSILEQTTAACSYCGELIGLLAIHLILLSVSRVAPELTGSVHIYLDWFIAVIYPSQDSSHTSRHIRTTEPNLRILQGQHS